MYDFSDMRNIILEWTCNIDCYRLSFFRCRDILVRGPRNTPISSKHFSFEKLGCHLMHGSFVIGNFTQNLAKSLLPLFKHLWRGTSICGFLSNFCNFWMHSKTSNSYANAITYSVDLGLSLLVNTTEWADTQCEDMWCACFTECPLSSVLILKMDKFIIPHLKRVPHFQDKLIDLYLYNDLAYLGRIENPQTNGKVISARTCRTC